jgi:hypothetical protein
LAGSKYLPVLKDTAKWICWLPLNWLGKRERGKGRGKTHSSLHHPCMRAPERSSLCWLVESERGEKERRKVALSEGEKSGRVFCLWSHLFF